MKNNGPPEGYTTVSVYMSRSLLADVRRIAGEERRTANNLLRLFVERGVAAHDGAKKKEKK